MSQSTSITPFDFEGKQVRTILRDWEIFFVAKDIAEELEIVWKWRSTIDSVPTEWVIVLSDGTTSGRDTLCLSEQWLYFFLARSDKPKALPLQKYIAWEVLPSIRKTGSYGIKPMNPMELAVFQANNILEMSKKVENHEERIHYIESRNITSEVQFFTVSWYLSLKWIKKTLTECASLGRECVKLSTDLWIQTWKVHDPRRGTVHTYHITVLDEVLGL